MNRLSYLIASRQPAVPVSLDVTPNFPGGFTGLNRHLCRPAQAFTRPPKDPSLAGFHEPKGLEEPTQGVVVPSR